MYDTNFIQDMEFLKELYSQKNIEQFVKIVSFNINGIPQEEIIGQANSGSVNVDGNSSLRRTCTLTLSCQKDQIVTDAYWSMRTQFKAYVGLRNDISTKYDKICWFPMGTFLIQQFSITYNDQGISINITGKDKMCLLNGEAGGILPASIDFTAAGGLGDLKTNALIYDIIRESVHTWGGEPYHNIIINDVAKTALNILEYRGENIQIKIESDDGTGYHVDFTKDPRNLLNHIYGYGDTVGYELTEFVYPGEKTATAGSTVTQGILDPIVQLLGNYEYFYDLDGRFVFQEKNNYLNNQWSPKQNEEKDIINGYTFLSPYTFEFKDSKLIKSYQRTPNLANIKNDYIVWGTKKTGSGISIPIHMRLSINDKPNKNNIPEEYHVYLDSPGGWRHALYRMALDNVKSPYDIYYADIIEFFDEVFTVPSQEQVYTAVQTVYQNYGGSDLRYNLAKEIYDIYHDPERGKDDYIQTLKYLSGEKNKEFWYYDLSIFNNGALWGQEKINNDILLTIFRLLIELKKEDKDNALINKYYNQIKKEGEIGEAIVLYINQFEDWNDTYNWFMQNLVKASFADFGKVIGENLTFGECVNSIIALDYDRKLDHNYNYYFNILRNSDFPLAQITAYYFDSDDSEIIYSDSVTTKSDKTYSKLSTDRIKWWAGLLIANIGVTQQDDFDLKEICDYMKMVDPSISSVKTRMDDFLKETLGLRENIELSTTSLNYDNTGLIRDIIIKYLRTNITNNPIVLGKRALEIEEWWELNALNDKVALPNSVKYSNEALSIISNIVSLKKTLESLPPIPDDGDYYDSLLSQQEELIRQRAELNTKINRNNMLGYQDVVKELEAQLKIVKEKLNKINGEIERIKNDKEIIYYIQLEEQLEEYYSELKKINGIHKQLAIRLERVSAEGAEEIFLAAKFNRADLTLQSKQPAIIIPSLAKTKGLCTWNTDIIFKSFSDEFTNQLYMINKENIELLKKISLEASYDNPNKDLINSYIGDRALLHETFKALGIEEKFKIFDKEYRVSDYENIMFFVLSEYNEYNMIDIQGQTYRAELLHKEMFLVNTYYSNVCIQDVLNPEEIIFWLDILDNNSELASYKINRIGLKSKVTTDNAITSLAYKEIPALLFHRYDDPDIDWSIATGHTIVNIPKDYNSYFQMSGISPKTAYSIIEDNLYTHTYLADTITISVLPMYHLEPNSRIYVTEGNTGIDGSYTITSISIPLAAGELITVSAAKSIDRLY